MTWRYVAFFVLIDDFANPIDILDADADVDEVEPHLQPIKQYESQCVAVLCQMTANMGMRPVQRRLLGQTNCQNRH
jgi:hypothetical protein